MPSQASGTKLSFRGKLDPEPITTSGLDTAERILARLVALAYVADHLDLFPDKAISGPTCSGSAVIFVGTTALVAEAAQHE
jgi:hypothetical protein